MRKIIQVMLGLCLFLGMGVVVDASCKDIGHRVYAGDEFYSKKYDRDGDGVGCESYPEPTQRVQKTNNTTDNVSLPNVMGSLGDGELNYSNSGHPYYVINNNEPYFGDTVIDYGVEFYSDLDSLCRVGYAEVLLEEDMMPADGSREGSLSEVTPTGWVQNKRGDVVSSMVDGGWLYNRSHLVGWQLTGQTTNPKNLMTGTRSFNVDGMLPFENYVADYIERTGLEVRYRITPYFVGDELLARGLFMEAMSLEDDAVRLNVYIPNVQDGITLNYSDGSYTVGGSNSIQLPEHPHK